MSAEEVLRVLRGEAPTEEMPESKPQVAGSTVGTEKVKSAMRELKRAVLFLLLWPFVCVFTPIGFFANLIWDAIMFGWKGADAAFTVFGDKPDDSAQKG